MAAVMAQVSLLLHQIRVIYLHTHRCEKSVPAFNCENAEYLFCVVFFCEWYFVAGADSVTVEGWGIDLVHTGRRTLNWSTYLGARQHNNRCGWQYLSELWSEWAVHNGKLGGTMRTYTFAASVTRTIDLEDLVVEVLSHFCQDKRSH